MWIVYAVRSLFVDMGIEYDVDGDGGGGGGGSELQRYQQHLNAA